jgi:site-specific DNA-cytosine methylase
MDSTSDIQSAWEAGMVPLIKPYKPSLTHTPRFPSVSPGPDRLKQLFKRFAALASPADVNMLKSYVLDVWAADASFGSFCSGTDSPVYVYAALWDVLQEDYGIKINFKHVFSTEIEPTKQDYLQKMFPSCALLFKDVMDLSGETAHCVKNQCNMSVPKVKCAAGGFPCQDASGLNPYSSNAENRSCVASGKLRTGSVLEGISSYVEGVSEHLECLHLENVDTLKFPPRDKTTKVISGPSNLDAASYSMDVRLGKYLHAWELDPRMWGVPASRLRIWMCVFDKLKNKLGQQAADDMLNDIMQGLVGFHDATIESYLLDETDPTVVRSRAAHAEKAGRNSQAGSVGQSSTSSASSRHNAKDSVVGFFAARAKAQAKAKAEAKAKVKASTTKTQKTIHKWVDQHGKLFHMKGEDWLDKNTERVK